MKTYFDLNKVIAKYGLKQVDLARAAGLSAVTISNYRRGTAYPSIPSLIAMSDKLNIPVEDFFVYEQDCKNETNEMMCPYCHRPISISLSIPRYSDSDENKNGSEC